MTWRPVIALLLLAPYLGEVLSTATSPLDLLLPWKLAMFAALYGSGTLLCRELAYRWGLGPPGWTTTGPLGHDGLWVVTGIIGFFIGLDALVGLGGRYDLSVGALLLAVALIWLHRRVRATVAASPR
ncbi:hypothetical protein ACLQ2R_06380 [Streptosporangium sp. DT93]|uniref:hypothetical protein n=1 Tax=Streptosporangium sp. DT93 TaxID=3393428 RepID=UPI003CF9CE11